MRDRRNVAIVGALVLVLIAAPGCVSSRLFKSNVEDTDSRVSAVENAVEDNEKKLDDLRSSTDNKFGDVRKSVDDAAALSGQAMTKAESAERAAQGKLLWTVTISNDNVKFPFGQAALSSDAIASLDGLVSKVKASGKALYIEVEGHTDNVGDDALNVALSEKRAMAVRTYLNQNGGIPLHAMNTIAFGESKPVADNSSREGRAQNRRVVIRVLE